MAVTFQTDFESYANGWSDLGANGWSQTNGGGVVNNADVTTAAAHSGSKSVLLGNHVDGAGHNRDTVLSRAATPSDSGRSGSVEAWGLSTELNWNDDVFQQWGLSVGLFRTGALTDGQVTCGFNSLGTAFRIVSSLQGILATIPATIPLDWHSVRLDLKLSTVLDDFSDVNEDGFVKAYLNGQLIHDLQGIKIYVSSDFSGGNLPFTRAYFTVEGYLDDVIVRDDEDSAQQIPPPDSTPCCGDPIDPTGTDGQPGPTPLQPWTRRCAGGGDVPQASDLVDVEAWSL